MFGSKNPPWAKPNSQPPSAINQNALLLQQNALGQISGPGGMIQYQQPQVFQTNLGLPQQNIGLGLNQLNTVIGTPPGINNQLNTNQIFGQTVQYPTPRCLTNQNNFHGNVKQELQQASVGNTTQRVFTGTVTKLHDNFGFVDDDVFFQTTVCAKDSNPAIGDRVLVEASFNANMPFKWNASRIQVIPKISTSQSSQSGNSGNGYGSNRHSNHNSKSFSHSNTYNAVPPPLESTNFGNGGKSSRLKTLVRSRERSMESDDVIERKRRRETRGRSRDREDKSKKDSPPIRKKSVSPKRSKRPPAVPRYMVHIPKVALDL